MHQLRRIFGTLAVSFRHGSSGDEEFHSEATLSKFVARVKSHHNMNGGVESFHVTLAEQGPPRGGCSRVAFIYYRVTLCRHTWSTNVIPAEAKANAAQGPLNLAVEGSICSFEVPCRYGSTCGYLLPRKGRALLLKERAIAGPKEGTHRHACHDRGDPAHSSRGEPAPICWERSLGCPPNCPIVNRSGPMLPVTNSFLAILWSPPGSFPSFQAQNF